jgi:cytosine/adenosine deaminase-related metal-dependent hydrolase
LVLAAGLAAWFALDPPVIEVPPAESLVLRDVTVVNPGRNRSPNRQVRIDAGRISSVLESTGTGDEFTGYFALPGLIDSHVHLPLHNKLLGLLFLAHGVTAVRDTGTLTSTAVALRRAVLEGEYPGPRIFTCGRPLDGDPPVAGRGNRAVSTAEEARAAVAELAEAGVDCIKPYDNLEPEVMHAIADAAREHGLPIVGHVPLRALIDTAGVQDVQHLTGFPLEPGEVGRRLELTFADATPARIDAFVATSLANGIAHTPTVVTWHRVLWLAGPDPPQETPASSHLPRYVREVIWRAAYEANAARVDDAERAMLARSLENARETVLRLHRAGVPLHAGTDMIAPYLVAGESLHEELALLSEVGLGPEQAWATATVHAAAALGEPSLGVIQPGAHADVLLFREDPTRDLAALATLEVVIAQGRVYRRATLEAALARYDEFYASPIVDGLTMALARAVAGLADIASSD